MTVVIGILSAIGYLIGGSLFGGYLGAREDPEPGKPTEDAKIMVGASLIAWPLLMVCVLPYDFALKRRDRILEKRAAKALPAARVV